MPERPLILFPKYETAEKEKRQGGPRDFHKPSHTRQVERLTPQFASLQRALDNGNIKFQQNAEHIEPEYTLVLEVAGDPSAFDTAIRNLQETHEGVEWLFELIDDDCINDEDFFRTNQDGTVNHDKRMTFKYFCVLTNQRALEEILSLWRNYIKNEDFVFPRGKTGLRNVFQSLKDIHIWGVAERLEETGVLDAWEIDLQDPDIQYINCEIELFFRKDSSNRSMAQNKVENTVIDLGGTILSKSCIPEIQYHALLVSIPRYCVENILNNQSIELISLEQIMFFKPTGQSIVQSSTETIDSSSKISAPDFISEEPIIALFDGLPQENHAFLENFLIIDDPDNYSSTYQVSDRVHGTSMASLILHGDLESYDSSLIRKLYVRPIMKPYPMPASAAAEFVPDNILLVDLIHQAVIRLFETKAGRVAPTIRVINLSIGVGHRIFYNMISPLAKLIDWLSYKYRVLFIISAGNHSNDIDLGIPFSTYKDLSDDKKQQQVIQILHRDSRKLKLLSPAESMNALSIGALFQDNSSFTPSYRQLLPGPNGSVSLISALGCGINRSIKPEIVFEGGRNVLLEDVQNQNIAHWRFSGNNPPGILSARPVSIQSGNPAVGYSFGTSNATAQISHNAGVCFEILDEIFNNELHGSVPNEFSSLLLKAMLVHGASWDSNAEAIRNTLSFSGRAADDIHRWIGYGQPNITRVKECTKNRITLIGYGELEQNEAHVFDLPLPFDFHTGRIFRSLTITLSSFTPIKPNTQKYRSSQLWFRPLGIEKLRLSRTDASDKAVARGTLQHERFSGDSIVVWNDDDLIQIKVNCRAYACDFEDKIPYALLCTFEIAPELDIDVYQKVINKIQIKEPIIP